MKPRSHANYLNFPRPTAVWTPTIKLIAPDIKPIVLLQSGWLLVTAIWLVTSYVPWVVPRKFSVTVHDSAPYSSVRPGQMPQHNERIRSMVPISRPHRNDILSGSTLEMRISVDCDRLIMMSCGLWWHRNDILSGLTLEMRISVDCDWLIMMSCGL